MVKVGDKINAVLTLDGADESTKGRQRKTGSVVYVHPKGRFCRATFKIGHDTWHQETFQLVNGKPLPQEAEIIHEC